MWVFDIWRIVVRIVGVGRLGKRWRVEESWVLGVLFRRLKVSRIYILVRI